MKLEELRVKMSDKDEEVKKMCHEEEDLRSNLDQLQLDKDQVLREKTALADKVSLL